MVASIVLGLASLENFLAAANEGARIYLVVAALIAAAGLSIWMVRDRTPIAVALLLLWPLGLWYGLRQHITGLGLAFHGEFVLHHFAALLCLVLAVMVPIGWVRDTRLGPARFVPAALAVPGAIALASAHLGQIPVGPAWLTSPSLATIGAALLLLAWPCAAVVFWRQLGPPQRRPLALVLLLPVVVRLGFAGPQGLSGELVDGFGVTAIGAAIVLTSIVTLVLLRPRVELWVLIVVGLICLLGSMFFYYLYEHGFGELEDGLGGLLQSLFGFQVPYPSYVDDVRSAALMMGLFFLVVTVYAALVSAEDRVRGIALGLMAVAGIGFSSPHLVLMLGTGALLMIEGLLPGAPFRELAPRFDLRRFEAELEDSGVRPAAGSSSVAAVHACIVGLAERLGLPAPTLVHTGPDTAAIGLRGEIDGPLLDLRARIDASATRIEIVVGLPGRGEPTFELVPDAGARGQRPAHLLARSHRVHGELRALEAFGDAPLDALTSFPGAYLRAWDGGVQIDLGRELHGLRVDNLEALVRSLARVVGSV
ncbi:MAG TPA: hypothetical protein VM869_08455 [Enhygromyxa sp.]|nr:hypothetical protein [Enhygromyxa sp.]